VISRHSPSVRTSARARDRSFNGGRARSVYGDSLISSSNRTRPRAQVSDVRERAEHEVNVPR
jgi:hypothetical protein